MKVLQLGKYYPPDFFGGIETVLYDITEGLNEKGIKCDILCSNTKNQYIEENINGYKIYRTKNLATLASTPISPQIRSKLKELIDHYDIIHIHLPNPIATIALMFTNHKSKKIVLHWHSDIIKQKYLLKLYKPFQEWILKRADVIISTSPKYITESPYLVKYSSKCISIPIGIDENRLQVKNSIVNEIKKTYGKKKIVFSLGRLTYYKGFEYLIESAKYLDNNFIILIGGEGELKDKLKSLIQKNNLNNKVKLLGKIPQDKLGSYYKAADLFVLPSIEKSEAFGVVQIEAMSLGKPIVATKIKGSGVDWVNQHEVTGFNVSPKNPQELAIAIKKILQNENIYKYFSTNAKKRFDKFFKKDRMINSIIDVYSSL